MPTQNDFNRLIRLTEAGSLTITTSKHAANRIDPTSAKRLMDLGFAKYGPGGRGNCNFIVPTERGIKEAELATVRSEANA